MIELDAIESMQDPKKWEVGIPKPYRKMAKLQDFTRVGRWKVLTKSLSPADDFLWQENSVRHQVQQILLIDSWFCLFPNMISFSPSSAIWKRRGIEIYLWFSKGDRCGKSLRLDHKEVWCGIA